MKCVKYVLASLAAIFHLGATAPVQAQVACRRPAGLEAAMTKLFPTSKPSRQSRNAAARQTGQRTITLLMGFALLDGN